GEETKVINTAQSSQAAAGAWQSDKNRRVSVLAVVFASNPNAEEKSALAICLPSTCNAPSHPPPCHSFHVCFPCSVCVYSFCGNMGDDGLYAPPLTTEVGGEGSHSTRPERWKGVCAVECDTHGHWVWTLNHRGLVCVSHPSFFNPYSTFYTSPGATQTCDLHHHSFSAAKWVLVCEEHISWLCGCLLLPLPGDRAWARLVFTQQSDSVKSSKALKVSLHQRPEPIRADTTLPSPHGRAA
ncbi:Coiled-coil domain containing protein 22, partial [Dissostichus eleginoides]